MRKIKLAFQMCKNMGLRYVVYRIGFEIRKKIGLLKRKYPTNLEFIESISLEEWKKNKKPFLIDSKDNLDIPKYKNKDLENSALKILSGNFLFFNHIWINIGKDYDWVTNPTTDFKYDITKHWIEIPDLSEKAGDIKFVWEKSRFSYILTLIRYDYHYGKDLSEFIFSEIESWIDANTQNSGPNWICSQEISLRILNWCYALYYYQDSDALTEKRWYKIQQIIYTSLHHVRNNINFSRIAVRNNHAITETLFLTLSNILFPFIPETEEWSKEGEKWFQKEIDYQIYEDGTFLQFSMNYHRVVIQLLSFGISLYKINDKEFSTLVYNKAYKSLNFLYQCMQDESGWLPNYGSNDGAWFFPLSNSDYRDFRPQINTLHTILTGMSLFNDNFIKEDWYWSGMVRKVDKSYSALSKVQGTQSFDDGGYYLCRNKDFFTFIRCGKHKDRPSQADNLHIDIWYKGENILRDSGTYKYNTTPELSKYFMGSISHNVVVVNNQSQMLKGGRFIWYYWTQAINAEWEENTESFIFNGHITAFRHINSKASHKRKITIYKNNPSWVIEDQIINLSDFEMQQVWHTDLPEVSFDSNGKKEFFISKKSNYYGEMEEYKSVLFKFGDNIKTIISYKE